MERALISLRGEGFSLERFDPRDQGTYGQVFFGRRRRGDGDSVEVAVKSQKVATDERPLDPKEPGTAMVRERAAHESLVGVPGVLPLLGVLATSAPGGFPHALVFPRCDLSLKDVRSRRERLGGIETLKIFTEVVRTLAHTHARGIIHRDVTEANIFLAGPQRRESIGNSQSGRPHAPRLVYLGDWGSAIAASDSSIPISSYVTARWYRAPEILLGSNSYDERVDVWSAGVVACIIFGGTAAWPITHRSVTAQWQAIQVLPRVFGDTAATWEWARRLPSYEMLRSNLVMGYGRGAVSVRERVRRARATSYVPAEHRTDAAGVYIDRLVAGIEAALTLDPRKRPTAAQLLAILEPDVPRAAVRTPPPRRARASARPRRNGGRAPTW